MKAMLKLTKRKVLEIKKMFDEMRIPVQRAGSCDGAGRPFYRPKIPVGYWFLAKSKTTDPKRVICDGLEAEGQLVVCT